MAAIRVRCHLRIPRALAVRVDRADASCALRATFGAEPAPTVPCRDEWARG